MPENDDVFFLGLIESGFLRVDAGTGAVVRLQAFGRTGRPRPVEPRRAEIRRPDGYLRVRVSIGGQERSILAHRLIWIACCGEIPADLEINHRDGQRDNNALSNLEVVTKGQNLQHAYDELGRGGPVGEANGRSKLDAGQVAEIRRRAERGEAKRALAREFGVSPTAIRLIVTGKRWKP